MYAIDHDMGTDEVYSFGVVCRTQPPERQAGLNLEGTFTFSVTVDSRVEETRRLLATKRRAKWQD